VGQQQNTTRKRQLSYLRLSITDRCNLRCQYCMPECGVDKQHHHDILRFEEYLAIIEALIPLGIKKVRITGGEPLVRRGVVGFVESLSALVGIEDVGMTTNGVLLPTMAQALYKSGLRRLNVSIDSLDQRVYADITRGGSLNQVLEGIELAKNIGFSPIKLNMVYIQGINDGELDRFIDLSQKGYHVRLIELMPIGEAAQWSKERFVKLDDVLSQREDLVRASQKDSGVCRYYKSLVHGGLVGVITPISEHFCDRCDKIRITADGMLKTCLHSEDEIDLKPYISNPEHLRAVVLEALRIKPLRHELDGLSSSSSKRNMVAVGG